MQKVLSEKKNFLKVIAGIENREAKKVLQIAKLASFAGVEALDICDESAIIDQVLALFRDLDSKTALFVSSLEAKSLLKADRAGADYLELGNYDHLYQENIRISPERVLEEAKVLIQETGKPQKISVTIPGYLEINQQVELTQKLVQEGVKIFQTEGGSISEAKTSGAIGLIEKAKITLANTIELRKSFPEICLISAGGLSSLTVPLALAAGASGVGVGKLINKLSSEIDIAAAIFSLKEALQTKEQEKTRV